MTTEENEVQIPEKFKALVENIEKLTVLDLAELVKILEKKFGVSAAAPAVASLSAEASAKAEAEAGEDEKTSFNVVLTGVGDKKIEVIKVVRDATSKGLKEAKDIVDAAVSGPQVVAENMKKADADELKKKFDAAGAKVELK